MTSVMRLVTLGRDDTPHRAALAAVRDPALLKVEPDANDRIAARSRKAGGGPENGAGLPAMWSSEPSGLLVTAVTAKCIIISI
jgi:hypothetical protein